MDTKAYVDGDAVLEMVREAGGDTLYAIGLVIVCGQDDTGLAREQTELVPGVFFCASLDDAREMTAAFDTSGGVMVLAAASNLSDDRIRVGDEVCVICEICENADVDGYDVERLLLESADEFRGEHYFVKQSNGTFEQTC